jgi:hypothetical protein
MGEQVNVRCRRAFLVMLLVCVSAIPLGAIANHPSANEEFFIVSSVNPAKSTMVLKRPTEITLTVRVTGKTRLTREDGKSLQLSDLRAGDTVFIALVRQSSGEFVASSIRQGVMTLPELQRRYLRPRQ